MSDIPEGNWLEQSIRAGNVLGRFVLIGALFLAYADLASRIKELEVKLDDFRAFIVSESHPPPGAAP